jgi:hypothetical protein
MRDARSKDIRAPAWRALPARRAAAVDPASIAIGNGSETQAHVNGVTVENGSRHRVKHAEAESG